MTMPCGRVTRTVPHEMTTIAIFAGRESFGRVMAMGRYAVLALLGSLCLDRPRVLSAKGTPLFITWPTKPCVDVFMQLNHAKAGCRVDALTGHGSGSLPLRCTLADC